MISLYNELLNIWRDCIDEVDKMPPLIQDKYSYTLRAIEKSLSSIDTGVDSTAVSHSNSFGSGIPLSSWPRFSKHEENEFLYKEKIVPLIHKVVYPSVEEVGDYIEVTKAILGNRKNLHSALKMSIQAIARGMKTL